MRATPFLLCLLLRTGFAQDFDTARLERYFDVLDSARLFMGSVAVLREGKPVYLRSVGYADVEKGIAADAGTLYRVGSISKTFTAVLVMKTVEKGRLSLDDTVGRWFPHLQESGRITVRHLLTHRSGLHNFTDNPGYDRWRVKALSKQAMLDTVMAQRVDFPPGTRYAYSNTGYVLLTLLLEKVWGRPYARLLHRYVTRPLRLRETEYGGTADSAGRHAHSYAWLIGAWRRQPETHPSIPLGAGSVRATATEIARFAHALFSGQLLRKSSLEEMLRLEGEVGAGIFRIPFYDRRAYGHGGSIDGSQSAYGFFPGDGLSFCITSNGTVMALNDATVAVLSAVFGRPFAIPNYSKATLTEAEMDRYAGVYASRQLPMRIKVFRRDGALKAQATGQQAFPLEAHGSGRFTFKTAGIELQFDREGRRMQLTQSGARYAFERE